MKNGAFVECSTVEQLHDEEAARIAGDEALKEYIDSHIAETAEGGESSSLGAYKIAKIVPLTFEVGEVPVTITATGNYAYHYMSYWHSTTSYESLANYDCVLVDDREIEGLATYIAIGNGYDMDACVFASNSYACLVIRYSNTAALTTFQSSGTRKANLIYLTPTASSEDG